MTRMILGAFAVASVMTQSALAQSYRDQIRQAVAIYGLEAARQHAMAHYGPEAVRVGDGCLTAADQRSAARDSQIYADPGGRFSIGPGNWRGR
jgi:hypothetical protein